MIGYAHSIQRLQESAACERDPSLYSPASILGV